MRSHNEVRLSVRTFSQNKVRFARAEQLWFVPIWSWVSSAYWWKESVVLLFDNSELDWMTLEIGDINKTYRRGSKTEPCGTPVGEGPLYISPNGFVSRYTKLGYASLPGQNKIGDPLNFSICSST